ncbi:hypothetical protein L2D01_00085 [Hyphomonadaceae bacterium ML37]|nr:hypothetical protein L2D01_00085 [Hyphomonadaceae bacterium ML37]
MTRLLPAIALAVAFLAIAAGLKMAESAGLLGADTAQRAVQVIIGLGLAGFANMMPKRIATRRMSPQAEGRMQTARRIGGWALTLAGLAHAAIWAFAPVSIAAIASMTVVGAALAVTLVFAVRACRSAGKGAPAGPASGA